MPQVIWADAPFAASPAQFQANQAAVAAQAAASSPSVIGNPSNGSGVASGAPPRPSNRTALIVVAAVAVWFFFLK